MKLFVTVFDLPQEFASPFPGRVNAELARLGLYRPNETYISSHVVAGEGEMAAFARIFAQSWVKSIEARKDT